MELSTIRNPPIVRDFAFVTSSDIPFPVDNHSQEGGPPESHRQRTGSNSSSSSSSKLLPHQPQHRKISMSGRTQKPLSPVAEESEGDIGRRRLTSTRPGSRATHRLKPRPTSYVGQTSLIAEDLTIAMMSITPPPPPPRHDTKATTRRKAMSKTKSSFHNLRLSIRERLPNMRFGRVWKRS